LYPYIAIGNPFDPPVESCNATIRPAPSRSNQICRVILLPASQCVSPPELIVIASPLNPVMLDNTGAPYGRTNTFDPGFPTGSGSYNPSPSAGRVILYTVPST